MRNTFQTIKTKSFQRVKSLNNKMLTWYGLPTFEFVAFCNGKYEVVSKYKHQTFNPNYWIPKSFTPMFLYRKMDLGRKHSLLRHRNIQQFRKLLWS